MPSPEALRAAHEIATTLYGSVGGNYSRDAEIIDRHFAPVLAERDRLREACEAALKNLESWWQHKGIGDDYEALTLLRGALVALADTGAKPEA